MYQRTKLTFVREPPIPKKRVRHERPSKPIFLNLAEWSATAAGASRAFTELLSAFKRKFGEISGDRVCVHFVSDGDRPRVYLLRPAGLRPKRADRERCR